MKQSVRSLSLINSGGPDKIVPWTFQWRARPWIIMRSDSVMNWMFVFFLNSWWNPNAQCDSVRRPAFGRWLGHEGGALMNGMSALIQETPEDSPAPSAMWGHSEKVAICKSENRSSPDTESAGTLILDFSPSRTVRNKCLLFKFSVYGIFVIVPQRTETFHLHKQPVILDQLSVFKISSCNLKPGHI